MKTLKFGLLLVFLLHFIQQGLCDIFPAHDCCTNQCWTQDHTDNSCEQDWLFVYGLYRSGSTTTMAMLDLIPGFDIQGEHGGFIGHQLLTPFVNGNPEKRYQWPHSRRKHQEPESAWHGHTSVPTDFIRYAQPAIRAVLKPDPSAKVVGFKEVRYHQIKYIDAMMEVFPCARFIFLSRSEDQYKNGKMGQKQVPTETLLQHSKTYDQAAKLHAWRSFRVYTDQLDLDMYNKLLRWVGIKGCSYTSIAFANLHGGYKPANGTTATIFDDVSKCVYKNPACPKADKQW